MYLSNVKLAFPPSPSSGVVAYRIRVLPRDTDMDAVVADKTLYTDYPYSEIGAEVDDDGMVRAELSGLEVMPETEGEYDIFYTAADGSGNESPPMRLDDQMLDFEAPLAPGAGRLEY